MASLESVQPCNSHGEKREFLILEIPQSEGHWLIVSFNSISDFSWALLVGNNYESEAAKAYRPVAVQSGTEPICP